MSFESKPTCQDLQRNFDGFLDGELDARWMRSLALHLTRCPSCEADTRHAERVQRALVDTVQATVDGIDSDALWRSIEGRLERRRPSRAARLRESLRRGWGGRLDDLRVPALAFSAAAAALLALALWPGGVGTTQLASTQNHAHIDRIDSSASQVMVWTEPAEQTTAIWLANYEQ